MCPSLVVDSFYGGVSITGQVGSRTAAKEQSRRACRLAGSEVERGRAAGNVKESRGGVFSRSRSRPFGRAASQVQSGQVCRRDTLRHCARACGGWAVWGRPRSQVRWHRAVPLPPFNRPLTVPSHLGPPWGRPHQLLTLCRFLAPTSPLTLLASAPTPTSRCAPWSAAWTWWWAPPVASSTCWSAVHSSCTRWVEGARYGQGRSPTEPR